MAGLLKRKTGILKQQINLLTSKTTLSRQTKVSSQAIIPLNDQPVGPVAPQAKLETTIEIPTQCHKSVTGNSHCPNSHHGPTSCDAESTQRETLEDITKFVSFYIDFVWTVWDFIIKLKLEEHPITKDEFLKEGCLETNSRYQSTAWAMKVFIGVGIQCLMSIFI